MLEESFFLHIGVSFMIGLILHVLEIKIIPAGMVLLGLGISKELYDLSRFMHHGIDIPSIFEPIFDITTNSIFGLVGYAVYLFFDEAKDTSYPTYGNTPPVHKLRIKKNRIHGLNKEKREGRQR